MKLKMRNAMKNKTLRRLWLPMACMIFSALMSSSFAMATESVQLDEYHAGNGVACADCHGDTKERQPVPMVKCLECHDTEELAKTTSNVTPTNPHKNRHYSTEADCNLCHHQHRRSENFCLPCHTRFTLDTP